MSVRYNVSTLLTESIGSTREYEIDDQVLREDGESRHERVAGHTTFLRIDNGVLVIADLRGAQSERCSRCLREMELPVRFKIEEEFFASADAETGAALPPPEDPEAFRIDANHMLDLQEAIRQYWAAALAMQPLCQSDCRGLCPRCGKDLNESACSCPLEVDERWNALHQLVKQTEGS